MRSYETGEYAILKDGNFQLTMARVLASNFKSITITVPEESSDFDALVQRFKDRTNIKFIQVPYGANAVETREQFWRMNYAWICAQYEIEGNWDVLITDITGYGGAKPVVYNFNITKLPELNRPYIDRFFDLDLESIEQSLFTTVLNPRQREFILEVRPDLHDKVIVNTMCAHAELLPLFEKQKPAENLIFWPFRISDKAYEWEQFLAAFEDQGLHEDGYVVLCTDPNDTLECDKSFVMSKKLTKAEYYQMLSARPIIVMLDDIDTVLHPGTIEFFYYRCPVITYSSELVPNLNTIPDLRWLRKAIEDLEYNDVGIARFVYQTSDVDQFYNEEFISVRSY
jgi:hypothetical protein